MAGRARALRAAGLAAAVALAVPACWMARAAVGMWQDMHPPRVAPGPIAGRPELAGVEELALRASDGVALSAWWRRGRRDAAVVLVHGWGENREQMLPQALALAAAGFGFLLLDLRAHGASGGGATTSGDQERRDVAAAVDATAARASAVGALGFSIGAIAVAEVAAVDPRVRAVVLEAIQPDLEHLIRNGYAAHGAMSELPALWTARALGVRDREVRPADRLCAIAPRPLALVFGDRDRVAPAELGRSLLARTCGGAELWIVPGGAHGGWERAAPGWLERRLAAFFDAALPDRARPAGSPP